MATSSQYADACTRVVAHFDVDCFYAQAEILRQPSLRGRPVGITQKFLVVTCNYTARSLGVPKMVPIEEARRRCPDLVLLNGEDLTPYRAASKCIMALLGRFGTVERLGLDEGAVDITAEVYARVAAGATSHFFSGIVIDSGATTSASFPTENTEVRRRSEQSDAREGEMLEGATDCQGGTAMTGGHTLLMVGSQLVAEMRSALEKETGFQVSCGIAHNKMLAKMACSMNKPNKVTILLDSAASDFLAPMSVRKLPGVGHRMQGLLKDINVETVSDLRKVTLGQLSSMFGERIGVFMYHACRGYDPKPVQDKGPPKSLSVEDSFRNCINLKQVEDIMRSLAPDLVSRLDEDKAEFDRIPKLLTVKWRTKTIMPFTSVSGPIPADLLSGTLPLDKRREVAVEAGMRLVSRYFGSRPFHMVVLNIGATGFTQEHSRSSLVGDIRQFLQVPRKSPIKFSKLDKSCGDTESPQEKGRELPESPEASNQRASLLKVVSKREARMRREGFSTKEAPLSLGLDRSFEIVSMRPSDEDGYNSDVSLTSDDDENKSNWLDGGHFSSRWKGFKRSLSNQVFDIRSHVEYAGNATEAGEGVSSLKQADYLDEAQNCIQCGQVIGQTERGRQEHEDYHFALSLQEESAGSRLTGVVAPTSGLGTSRSRETHISPPLKRSKFRKGTLDGFLVRR